jgi:hypothetical protein
MKSVEFCCTIKFPFTILCPHTFSYVAHKDLNFLLCKQVSTIARPRDREEEELELVLALSLADSSNMGLRGSKKLKGKRAEQQEETDRAFAQALQDGGGASADDGTPGLMAEIAAINAAHTTREGQEEVEFALALALSAEEPTPTPARTRTTMAPPETRSSEVATDIPPVYSKDDPSSAPWSPQA